MTKSAQPTILSINIGQAVMRGVYLSGDRTYSAAIAQTSADPVYGLAALTTELSRSADIKINPGQVLVSGNQASLQALEGKIEAKFISEEDAIAAAEKYLTKSLGSPTAILDLGPSAFLDRYPAGDIGRWLPFVTNLTDIENHLANKRLYPRVLPVTEHEYEIDLAVARESIIKLGEKRGQEYLPIETKLNLVLTGGLLTAIPNQPDLVSILLDSFYFKKGVRIYFDPSTDLPTVGAILSEVPDAALPTSRQLKVIGSMLHLGGVERVSVSFGDNTPQRLSAIPGEIIAFPVGSDSSVKINVGNKGGETYELEGGVDGVYLDNRPRPLNLSAGSKDSISRILAWRKSLSVSELITEDKV